MFLFGMRRPALTQTWLEQRGAEEKQPDAENAANTTGTRATSLPPSSSRSTADSEEKPASGCDNKYFDFLTTSKRASRPGPTKR